MKGRTIAVVILAMMMFGMVAPVAVQGYDALDSNDYYIEIPGTEAPDQTIYKTLGNGESYTWKIYVVNASDKYLSISYSSSLDEEDLKITELPESDLLDPEGLSGHSKSEGKISFSVSELADPHDSIIVDIVLKVKDISPDKDEVESHIIFDIKVKSVFDTSGVYNKFFGIIPNTLPEPFNSAFVPAIVTVLVCALVTWALGSLLISRIAYYAIKNATEEEADKLEKSTKWLLVVLVLLFSINSGMHICGADPSAISTVEEITYLIGIVVTAVILWKVYMFAVEEVFKGLENNSIESPLDTSLIPLFKMIGRIIFWVAGASAILAAFGVDLQGILVSAGVISLGITLGAQNVLSQFFSGMVILITRPFKAGDFLKINDKVYIVQKVKLMYTEFKNWAGDEIITMPNNVVSSSTVSNMTKDDLLCKQYVYFSVAYGTDLEKAQEVMIEAAKKCDLVVEDAKHEGPTTRITNFLSSGIELRLAVYTPTFDDTGSAAGQLRGLVYKAFAENDIEIPYDRIQIDILSDHTEGASKTS